MEPVLVTGIFPVFKDVLECEKSPPCMVEHPVQYDPDASLVECAAFFLASQTINLYNKTILFHYGFSGLLRDSILRKRYSLGWNLMSEGFRYC